MWWLAVPVLVYGLGGLIMLTGNVAGVARIYQDARFSQGSEADLRSWHVTGLLLAFGPLVALVTWPAAIWRQARLAWRIHRAGRWVERGGAPPGFVVTRALLESRCNALDYGDTDCVGIGGAKFCVVSEEGSVCACGEPAAGVLGVDRLCRKHLYDAMLSHALRAPYSWARYSGWSWA